MSAQRDSLLLLELASRLLPADFLLNEIRETHLSLVFLGAKEAWKLKKPVSYPFVDQREQQVRWQFAVEEIRLNRRLAPSIYLGFRSLSESGFSAFSTAPQHEGEPVVVMKRVPEENFAHKRVESLDPVLHIAPLAERLARFHLEERVTVGTSVSSLVAAIEENFQSLRGLPLGRGALLKRLEQLFQTQDLTRRLEERADLECDGHGDLRLEHVVFHQSGVEILDCIDFSPALRILDPLADIAFLAMDLIRVGRSDLLRTLAQVYDRVAPGIWDGALLKPLMAYRALVRAKVAALQEQPERALDYLSVASRCFATPDRPLCLICFGLMGSGKTTLARELSFLLHAEHLETDRIRLELYPRAGGAEPFSSGRYAPEAKAAVYRELLRRTKQIAARQGIVIADGSFIRKEDRDLFEQDLRSNGSEIVWLSCSLPEEDARRRLRERTLSGGSLSEGREELYSEQASAFSPDVSSLSRVITCDMREPVESLALDALQRILFVEERGQN